MAADIASVIFDVKEVILDQLMIFRLGNDIFPGGQRFFEAFLWTTFMGLRNNRFTIMIRKTLGMITLRLNFFNARNMLSLKSTLPYPE
jgi:hypothetical protein